MKIKSIIVTLCILLATSIFSATSTAAAAQKISLIHSLSNDDLKKLGPTDINNIVVSEIEEDEKYYYFLLTDETIGNGIAILKLTKPNLSTAEIISVYDAEELKGYTIKSMSIGSNETIWLILSGTKNERSCKINNTGQIATVDYAYNSWAKHGTEGVLWREIGSNVIQRWDGEHIESYKRLNQDVYDFTEHNNQLYYLDINGNVNLVNEAGETQIAYLPSVWNMKDVTLETGAITSVGGKLWASVGIMHDSTGSVNFLNTGLINLTDNKNISEMRAATIFKTIENADGSLYFLTEEVHPIVPHRAPDGDELQELIITKNAQLAIKTVNGYWEDIERKYTDQAGNVWTYNLRSGDRGVIMTDPDKTAINYYFASSSKKPDRIKVKYNGDEIAFDVAPYIENGRTMVPFREVADLFGATTTWDASTQTATIQRDEIVIKLTLGEKKAYINGKQVLLDAPLGTKDGRIMVPLRFVGESLLIKAEWDQSSKTIVLNYN